MVERKNKEVDGYYFDGEKSTTLYKVEDGGMMHEVNTNTNTLVLTVDMLTPESKEELVKEQADKLQLIVDNLRKIGGI